MRFEYIIATFTVYMTAASLPGQDDNYDHDFYSMLFPNSDDLNHSGTEEVASRAFFDKSFFDATVNLFVHLPPIQDILELVDGMDNVQPSSLIRALQLVLASGVDTVKFDQSITSVASHMRTEEAESRRPYDVIVGLVRGLLNEVQILGLGDLVGTYVGKTFEVVRDLVRECPSCRIPKWDTNFLDSRSEITLDLSNHVERASLLSELRNWLRPRARVYGSFRCFDCANYYMEEYYRLYSRNMMIVIHFNRPEGSNTEIEFPIILSFSAPPQAPRIPDYKLTGIIHRINGRVVTEFPSGRSWTRSDNGFNTVIPRYSSDTGSRTATTFFYSRIDLL